MKLKFNSELQYQKEAIESVVNIFNGQSVNDSTFTLSNNLVSSNGQILMDIYEQELGIANNLIISEEQILENLRNIQIENGLEQDKELKGMNFTVEMETGTGKTYVYLKTMYELNKKYGFKKFIIVVPSIPIKEGVYKTLDITKEHFRDIFDNTPAQYFIYDSSKLELVKNFATSNNIEIMVMTIQSFKDDNEDTGNIIHRPQDKLNGEKPISLIQQTNPIVIIDEPQSVDNTEKAKDAIKSLNPLCTLRYSATHAEKYNMIYKLDAIDAYEQRLVKRIEVLSTSQEDSFNIPYVKLKSVREKWATIEIDTQTKKGTVSRKEKKVKLNDMLYKISGNRELYSDWIVSQISWEEGNEYIEFNNGTILYIGDEVGGIEDDTIKRLQISKTIEEHLEKELRLNKLGIKVLSLFFIDKVANYRGDGINPGKYEIMFKEEYEKLIKKPKFKANENIDTPVDLVHNGYFSQDKGTYKDSTGSNKYDEAVYNLIMKDKEKLLDKNNPLRFIFSHSALKEGWDNPNVFQICTLKDTTGTYIRRRQEIGRGLRLCVNQDGERIYDPSINVLTVLANESYESFVKGLQNEIQEDTGIKFGVLDKNSFTTLSREIDEYSKEYFGEAKSHKLHQILQEHGFIDNNGLILDKLKENRDSIGVIVSELDEDFLGWSYEITNRIKSKLKSYEIKDANKKQKVERNKEIIENNDFIELWNKISEKTVYSVDFDTEELILRCVQSIKDMPKIKPPKLIFRKNMLEINKNNGIEGKVVSEKLSENSYQENINLPDILSQLQNKTNLTRKTIIRILTQCDRLEDFKNNPQKFIDEVSVRIKRELNKFASNGIKYEKIGDYYSFKLFESEDDSLLAYMNDKSLLSNKSPYTHVVCESETERKFADKFEQDESVKIYMKLPSWFKINTPLGSYNPDWATVIEKDGIEKLYFVVESKGSENPDSLRTSEELKIECAKKHFKTLDTGVEFKAPVSDINKFMRDISN